MVGKTKRSPNSVRFSFCFTLNATLIEARGTRSKRMMAGLYSFVLLLWLLGHPLFLAAEEITEEQQHSRHDDGGGTFFDISKTYFLKDEDRFNVASQSALNLHDSLPVGSYTVGQYPNGEYYLKQIQPFDLDGKRLYGQVVQNGKRILETFVSARKGQATGVLLAGQKGSGKTLLAKYVSVQAAKLGISTIVVNEAWSGERFNAFIQSIQQPTIVLFDEFEKVYRQPMEAELKSKSPNEHHFRHYSHRETVEYIENKIENEGPNPSQDAILTLLDGVYPSNMLFLLTVNDKNKITKNMKNRPGRIYYVLDFAGLESDFVRDYCKDNLQNQTHVDEVVAMASLFGAFSFDMLQSLVEEMNFYKESPKEALKWLNVKLSKEEGRKARYHIQYLEVGGKDITNQLGGNPSWTGSPATDEYVQVSYWTKGFWGSSYQSHDVFFLPSHHLVTGNITSGEFIFESEERKSRLVLLRYQKKDPLDVASRLTV